jgi:adenylate kinase
MKLLMMGPQGCGKGTIGEMLSRRYGLPIISSGQLLRDLPKDHPRYKEITNYLNSGNLAPEDFVANLLKTRVMAGDCENGYIIDGWARNMLNLSLFDPGFDKVITLVISPQTSIARLSNRRTCSKCGKVYNLVTLPPKVEGICDVCGGSLTQRDDDQEEAIKKRLDIYYHETKEVLEYFRNKGLLMEVDAEPLPDVIFEEVCRRLNSENIVEK